MEQPCRVPVETGHNLLFVPNRTFDGRRNLFHRIAPRFGRHGTTKGSQQFRSRVTGPINAVPEPRHSFILLKYRSDNRLRRVGLPDCFENIIDVSSLHQAERFAVDEFKYTPDSGGQRISGHTSLGGSNG